MGQRQGRRSRAYRLEVGAGWQINPGILHAPGSLVTYEPQVASDVSASMSAFATTRRLVERMEGPRRDGGGILESARGSEY